MNKESIIKKIIQLTENRCQNPGAFDEFASQLLELQIIRQTYDVLLDELLFYSADQLIVRFPAADIEGYHREQPFIIADTVDLELLKKSIDDFDQGRISKSLEFHRQIAKAGIVYVSVYLPSRKIYYLSQDGQYYLEHF
jgi:hypothetical protein